MLNSANNVRSTATLNPASDGPIKVSRARTLARTLGRFDPTQMIPTGRTAAKANGNADAGRYDARFKIVLLGDSGVGKTSLIRAAVGEPFNPTMISTIGMFFEVSTFHDAE